MDMKYCIIDDEPIAHRIIEGYCANLSYLQKIGNCYNAFEAMTLMNTHAPDLIFLDINMPELSGFDLLKTMNQAPKVIVTSAYKEYALEGYELNVADYLLKPFSLQRFLQAMNKVTDTQLPPTIRTGEKVKDSFFIKGDKKLHQVRFNQILFIEASGNYTKIFLSDEMILTHEKISALEELLPTREFIRVHKSFIVGINKIKLIEGNRISLGEHYVPIGQTYKHNLKELLRNE